MVQKEIILKIGGYHVDTCDVYGAKGKLSRVYGEKII